MSTADKPRPVEGIVGRMKTPRTTQAIRRANKLKLPASYMTAICKQMEEENLILRDAVLRVASILDRLTEILKKR